MSHDAAIEPPESFDAFQRRLIEIEPHLPKRLRQAAAYALEHPDEFALGTASALARNAEVQASTLVRFAQTLGFAGFSELQEVFRSRLRDRWPDYSDRLRALQQNARDSGDPTNLLFGFADSAAASIARLREVVQRRELDQAVSLLARRADDPLPRPETVVLRRPLSDLCALPARRPGLPHRQCGRPRARRAGAGGPGDALIAVSFSPYTPFTVDLAKRARRADVPIVVITDSALSPLAGLADVRFEVVESDFGSFRSLSATFCLAMTLAVAVGEKRAKAARDSATRRAPRLAAKATFGTRNSGRRHQERDREHRHESEVKRLFERRREAPARPPLPNLAPGAAAADPTSRLRGPIAGGRN